MFAGQLVPTDFANAALGRIHSSGHGINAKICVLLKVRQDEFCSRDTWAKVPN